MNQAMATATVPVPAKLYSIHQQAFNTTSSFVDSTYKKPVLTPHLTDPLIIKGVQKLKMIAMQLDTASDQPAVWALRRCCGISAA